MRSLVSNRVCACSFHPVCVFCFPYSFPISDICYVIWFVYSVSVCLFDLLFVCFSLVLLFFYSLILNCCDWPSVRQLAQTEGEGETVSFWGVVRECFKLCRSRSFW